MENRQKILADEFINLYQVSKTLRFELRPEGRTQEFIELDGILTQDTIKAESYKKVKKIIDDYHKTFMDEALKGLKLEGLEKYQDLYMRTMRNDKEEKEFQHIKAELRKQIVRKFQVHPDYKYLFKEELFEKLLPEFIEGDSEKEELIKQFDKFSTYFIGFHQNRKNMYTDEEKATAVAFRIIHQNLPKYIDNMKIFAKITNSSIHIYFQELLSHLQEKFSIRSIEEYFEIQNFSRTACQREIVIYNTILNGYSEEMNKKVKGLNEYINLYNQNLQEDEDKIPRLKPLFKQILSDREKISFIPEQFENDEELLDALRIFCTNLRQDILENGREINAEDLLYTMDSYDLSRIYLPNDSIISDISQNQYKDWRYIKDAIENNYDKKNIGKRKSVKAYGEKREKALKQIKYYSLSDLNEIVSAYAGKECHMERYFCEKGQEILGKIDQAFCDNEKWITGNYIMDKPLCKDQEAILQIKALLDGIKELQWLLKPLTSLQDLNDKDELFYGALLRITEGLESVTSLYNKVRNYVTQKPYSLEKVKLNFYRPTLLDGWDKNKEKDNLGIILERNGLYYLGIMNRKCNRVVEEAPVASTDDVYRKMEYKLLPGPNKMLPKVFFSKSRIEEFAPSEELLEKYEKGTHKKGDQFDLQDCHALIDFYKRSLEKHEDWAQFDFHFTDTVDYKDISGFYREVEQQGYKLTFHDIDKAYIDELVENGQLYLFQIYNKDFSKYSKGRSNLHTLYWKMLFSPENLQNVVYKLNGQAEVFYRKASIKPEDIIIHEQGLPIENKGPETQAKKPFSTFAYPLIKDRRYTVDKYQFHVPVTMNFQASGGGRINQKVNRLIHDWKAGEDRKEMHVIGIDRGERNLLYLSVIDMHGNIVEQKSLNKLLSGVSSGEEKEKDYHALLKTREDENKKARQNWQTIHTIKELKAGYLSQVVHVIAELMISYNAIVVLEDLNFGFKRSRQKVERQVYQKFEKMLIDKLNYLVDKKKEAKENGGLLHAYQLTDKFESFQRIGKQSGFLYYVQAWNTSKIDPTTGFVNLFDKKHLRYRSREETRNFIRKLDKIIYNQENGYFEISFDYSRFTEKAELSRKEWTVCTAGSRFENCRNANGSGWEVREVPLTDSFIKLLTEYYVCWQDDNLQTAMIKVEETDFYQKFLHLFSLVLQMRNSNFETGEDMIVSPVLNQYGEFFVTRRDCESMPKDADANGAYHIAKKGLWMIEKIKNTKEDELDKVKLTISNQEWLKYAQENTI